MYCRHMKVPVPSQKDLVKSCNTGAILLAIVLVLKMFSTSASKKFEFIGFGL